MGRRSATIRDANAAKACADGFARRQFFFPFAAAFAILLLLCAPMLRAQATLGTISGVTNAFAINSNNSTGQAYNAVLNTDSSVSLLQDGAILGTVVCAPYTVLGASITVSTGAIFVDSANSRIYLAMIAGGAVYAAYESFNQTAGTCTPGPLLTLTTNALSNLEMNVDPLKGNVYILNSFGAFPDTLYILPIASWSASSAAKLNMDYSAQYGPIVIDPSNDLVYVNDLGGSAYGTVGTYSTSGFFVYDPNFSATPANNLQHVVGYNASGGMPPTPFYVGTLLSNGAGKLVLVNENPSASSTNLSVPITILNTTAPQSLFFTNTTNPYSYNNDVDITPGTALSTISATAQYEAISGADIDAVNQVVYAYAFNIPNSTQPGMLLKYNLSSTANPQETVLSSAAAKPNLYGSLAPWGELNYDSESTELVLSVSSEFGSGALGLTSPLCAGTPLTQTQLFGGAVAPTPLGYPVVNSVSGYTYAIQPAPSNPPGPSVVNFVAPSTGGCTASTPIQISPATITYGFAEESYFENFTATGGSGTGYVWSVTSGTALSAVGLSLTTAGVISGSPNAAETAVPFTVQVIDSQGNTAAQNYTLTIYPDISVLPTSLPAGTVGTPYPQMFTATGGSGGPYSFSVASGTALSAVGLTLSPGGLISGTPSPTETAAPLTIQVADSLGDFTQLNYTLTISSASSGPITINDPETVTVNDSETQVQLVDVSDPETITVTDTPVVTVNSPLTFTGPASLPAGEVNAQYNATITVGGGSGTGYSFSVTGQPAWLTLSSTGTLSGTPNATGPFSFTVKVTDSVGNANSSVFSVTVDPPLTFASAATLPAGDLNANYTFTITASGGTGTGYSFSATGLPAGLSIGSNTGAISGTVMAAGPFSFTVTVTDSAGYTNPSVFSLTVDPALTFTSAASLPAGDVNANYTFTITASGGTGTGYSFSATGLPAGLSIGTNTGTISGTPTAVGTSPVTVIVLDANQVTTTKNFTLTVEPPPTITGPALLTAATLNEAYTPTTIAASGGTPPYTWSATGLPAGLSINSSTSVISGTPTVDAGSPYSVTVTVEDSNGIKASNTYSLIVEALPLAIASPASLPPGGIGVPYPTTTITASGGSQPYSFAISGLPPGLTTNGGGVISGIPTTDAGSPYSVQVTVTDSTGKTANMTYSLAVSSSLAITSPSSLPNGDAGEAYTPTTISASGGSGVYTWSATGLPSGLTIGSTTGTITGTANTAGAYYVTVNVEDANGITASKNYTITVVLPSVTISANPNNITIIQGQTGETTITLTPQGNYTGTFTLSVSDQPANTSSVFTLNGVTVTSVTLTGNNQTVNVVLAINTDVISTQAHTESAPTPLRPGAILTAIGFWCPGSLLGLIALRRKRKLFTKNPGIFGLCVVALLVGTLAGLAGCISGGGFGTYVTPAGTSTVTVVATPGSGSAQTLNIGLTIKQQ